MPIYPQYPRDIQGYKNINFNTALTTYYVDCQNASTGDGTISNPFQTMDAALTAMAGNSNAAGFVIHIAPGTYTTNNAVSLPSVPITAYGNNATWYIVNGATVNGTHAIYNLNTVGAVTYAYQGTTRSIRIGGSINGTVSITGGFPHFDSLNYTGTMTITGGTPYFRGITGGGRIILNGASAILSVNDANMNMNLHYANIAVTAGQLIVKGGLFVNDGTLANITMSNTNTLTTAHELTQVAANYGIDAGANAYTLIAPDCILPSIAGTLVLSTLSVQPAVATFGVGGGTANAQTATIPILATAYVAGMRIAYIPTATSTSSNPTVNVNGLGAKTVVRGIKGASSRVLVSGDITLGYVADMIYDGTNLLLMNPQGA